MLVYKYLHSTRSDVLANGLIRFTQPAALNDPFETLPNLQVVREGLRERAHEIIEKHRNRGIVEVRTAQLSVEPKINEKLAKFQKDSSTRYAFLSLSKKRSDLLMWSHYADSHRGFVVAIDPVEGFSMLQCTAFAEEAGLAHHRFEASCRVVGLDYCSRLAHSDLLSAKIQGSEDWKYDDNN